MRPGIGQQPRVQWNETLPAKQLVEFHIEEYDVKGRQLVLNCWVQRRAATKREHSGMICQNITDESTLNFTEFLPAQLDNQLAGGQTTLILQVIIEVAKRYTQLFCDQPSNGALSRPRWTDEDQDRSAHHASKPPS